MVEVFITDIQNNIQAELMLNNIEKDNPDLKINLDLNAPGFAFPCGHTILRVEGNKIISERIMAAIRKQGFNCELLEDKICKQTQKL